MPDRATLPHILVVDDEPAQAEEIVEYLRSQRFTADFVDNGPSALQRLSTDTSISVMLSDIRMSGMDGLALARAAIAQRGDEFPLEVVMLTGNATVADAAESVRFRAVDFLTKPVPLAILKNAVLRAFQAAQARKARWRENRALQSMVLSVNHEISGLHTLVATLQRRLQSAGHDGGQDTFMSLVNHELRTPLVPIIGLAEMIEGETDALSKDDLRSFAREIRLGGERLERAITRIAELTNLLSGRAVVEMVPCDANRIIQTVERSFASRLEERHQQLVVSIAVPSTIISDTRRLTQAMSELIDNAIRFSPDGASVEVGAKLSGSDMVFTVTDKGPGMTANDIDRAMRPFEQVDSSYSRPAEGLGLGLPMASRIATLLNGTFTLESQPGKGTVATFSVPAGTA